MILVTGGSGSGKSEFAEDIAVQFGFPLYYIATMHVADAESEDRVRRHRMQREGKGFQTVECPVKLEEMQFEKEGATVLLEDLSNLLANEMYLPEGRMKMETGGALSNRLKDVILNPIFKLAEEVGHLVIVSNEVFSDGIEYDAETMRYIRLLATLNRELAKAADGVVEVVCGIPLWRKRR